MYMVLISCSVWEPCWLRCWLDLKITVHSAYDLSDNLFQQCGVCLIVTQRYVVPCFVSYPYVYV